jgi:UDP-N-acetylglucosamine transferase subunit ALG13
MIFYSVGTQLPFDRLTGYLDQWCEETGFSEIIGQVARGHIPKNFKAYDYLSSDAYKSYFIESELIVSHAGMGSILTAIEYGKPIVIVPRKFELGEHRNDHQLSTVKRFRGTCGIYVAENYSELVDILELDSYDSPSISQGAVSLIENLRQLIAS